MDTSDKDINWDKLLDALEGTNTEPLNAAEQAMLTQAGEVQQRLEMRRKFPADEGWQRFVAARDGRGPKLSWWKPVWKVAAAAAVLGILVTVGLQLRKQGAHQPKAIAKADLKPSHGIQLSMSNGDKVQLDTASQTLQYNNGTRVLGNGDSIVYQAESGQQAANRMDTLLVPRGNKIRLVLSDGTAVWVNADTKLIYAASFTGPTREVWIQGEAFFEVAARAQQPFVVHTSKLDVKVLGTSFNVNTYAVNDIQTTLTAGKVRVSDANTSLLLSPGEQSAYDAQGGELIKQPVDTRIFTAWKDDNIYFEDAQLSDIANNLGRSFDYNFKFENASIAKLRFTLDMQQPATLQAVLDQIHITVGDVKFRVEERTVYISR